ncbi:MAG: hypothetical protein ACE5JI_10940 [Acidobacteriota bacterium]
MPDLSLPDVAGFEVFLDGRSKLFANTELEDGVEKEHGVWKPLHVLPDFQACHDELGSLTRSVAGTLGALGLCLLSGM